MDCIHEKNSGWTTVDERGNEYHAKHIIFSGSIQQLPSLVNGLSGRHRKLPGRPTWITHTLYLLLDGALIPDSFPPFRQISSDSRSEGSHLFMSLSAKYDRLWAPEGKRTMTVSTHSSPDHWQTKQEYDAYKEKLTEKMLAMIGSVYPNFRKPLSTRCLARCLTAPVCRIYGCAAIRFFQAAAQSAPPRAVFIAPGLFEL
ncbi:hypothetical protein M3221_09795 [Domibacillus indicus]|uniref:hypothetical protein n=1 Tax=Domibacillus indicus TaxID=1437523 RepID=UPI00203AEADA|nr:hypothetical protein [Domibacillus indicus]MCM3788694.1 hypothetical protein [Domibacillus indicus]